MGQVIYRARDRSGATVHAQIGARTLDEAHAELTRRGLTDIEFLTDAVVPDLDGAALRREPVVAPNPTWKTLVVSFRNHFGTFAIVYASFWGLGARHWLFAAGCGLLAVTSWVFVAAPVIVFQQLQDSKARGRWDLFAKQLRFLRLANTMVAWNRTLRWAFDGEEARLLAATGRFDAAVEILRKHEGTTAESRALHQSSLCGICLYADREEDARTHARASVALAPQMSSYWIELAMREVECGDTVAARTALERASGMQKSAIAKTFERLTMGRILLEEQAFAPALAELGAVREAITSGKSYSTPGFRAICELWYAVALAETGDPDAADRSLVLALPFMHSPLGIRRVARARAAITRARARTPYRGELS